MAKLKLRKFRLKDLSNEELVSRYTSAVRITWGKQRDWSKSPALDPDWQRENHMKRELLRRLAEGCKRVTVLVHGPYPKGVNHKKRLISEAKIYQLVTVPQAVFDDKVKLMAVVGVKPRSGVDLKKFVRHMEQVFMFDVIHVG